MTYIITILTVILTNTVFGQTKDRRAELDILGRVNEISVSPDEKLWLVTAMGNTYYTENIDSNWHYGNPLFNVPDDFSLDHPHLERISFFNSDTAILTGYISAVESGVRKNGYYLTKDAGKSWQLLDYGGDSWIYAIHIDKEGNAWMGGLSKELYYSNDFGQSWTTLKLPYKYSDRTYCINMTDSKSGIAGSDRNEIITTEDNWETILNIQTPLDQKTYQPENTAYGGDRISKILKWDNYIVLNQDGHIFYSSANDIEWKSFPIRIIDFEMDSDSKQLFAVTDSLKIISFSTPTEFHKLTDKPLSDFPIDIKAVNHSLFLVCAGYEIYKVNENILTHVIPYTTDKEISEPNIVKRFAKLNWGINGNQIYLADDSRYDWYRANALEFGVADFILLSDSVAILWDGVKNNYLYSLKDHTLEIYYPENPIINFLVSPVNSFSINSGSQGCFHSVYNEVRYEREDDSTFKTLTLFVNNYDDNETSKFKNKVNSNYLSTILNSINLNPATVPTFEDFENTEQDKKNYFILVDDQINSKEKDYFGRKKKINKEFYYSVPAMLDTINNSIISTILDQREGVWSTTSNWFNVHIVNQNNDTLKISRHYFINNLPWNLPWNFEYRGLNFNCYNIEFSRFINSCIPENFIDKEIFDNKFLILLIADYLYNKQK